MRKLLAIVYGCCSKGQHFDPTFEEGVKARQQDTSQEEDLDEKQTAYMRALICQLPSSQREAKRRRKTTSPQKCVSPSARGQGAFP